ncbi:MAG: DNA primase [Thermodesulfobacteriota bacterium]
MEQSSYDFAIEEIKRRLSLVDLIETYISLKKSGKNYIGLCPFHDDKNPSLHVNEEKGLYHCFSCGAGGDVFGFIMNYNNISFKEAVQELAAKLNIEIKEKNHNNLQQSSKRSNQLKVNQSTLKFFHNNLLKNKDSQSARDYLKGRGINIDLAKEFKIGFAGNSWEGLINHFNIKKIPLKVALELGLINKNKNKQSFFDTFRKRIIFPIIDVNGDVIGFGGRVVSDDDKPKYLNSPESDIYKKRKSFYGLFHSREHIRKQDLAILVEGYMDFLSLYSAGIRNVIATLGTSFAVEHASNLKRYTRNIVILYDGDESGLRASVRSGEILLQAGLSPKIVKLPGGYDPDLMVREKGVKPLLGLIESSMELTGFFIDKIYKDFKGGAINRGEAAEQLVRFGEKIENKIDQSHYIHYASDVFGFRESDLHSMFNSKKMNLIKNDKVNNKIGINSYEMLILKICLNYPALINQIDKDFVFKYINDDNIKQILIKMISSEFEDISMIINEFKKPEIKSILSNAIFSSEEVHASNSTEKMLDECINRLKLKKIREQLVLKRNELNKNDNKQSALNEKKLMEDYRNLIIQEQQIKGELHEI